MVLKSRRDVLCIGTLSIISLLSGCTDRPFEQPDGVQIVNRDDVPHEVTVKVSVNDDEKIASTIEVAARGEQNIDTILPRPGLIFGRRFETTVELAGGQTRSKAETFRGSNGFDRIIVHIDENASIDISYADKV